MSGIGEERVDGSAGRSGPQLIHPVRRRQVCFNDGDRRAKTAEPVGGRLNLGPISSDKQIESLLRTDHGQFESDARRSARHHREWFIHLSSSSGMSPGNAPT